MPLNTPLGTVHVLSTENLYAALANSIAQGAAEADDPVFGLTGGSTPLGFYRWATAAPDRIDSAALQRGIWMTSDERWVPASSDESNFGNACRLLLNPLGVNEENTVPWPVHVDPHSSGILINRTWDERFGPRRGFTVCFLGMGDDAHTASIFPGSPLIGIDFEDNFMPVDVPGKGWRLTITHAGLSRCGRIVVGVAGANKREALSHVFGDVDDPERFPAQILKRYADCVTWLLDEAAGVDFV